MKIKDPQKAKNNIDGLNSQDIEKLKKILDAISVRLEMSSPPHIIYVPFKEFSKEIQQFEIIGWLRRLDKDFNVIKFTNIVGREPSEQEAEIRVGDKQKFNEGRKIIDKRFDEIIQSQPSAETKLTKLSLDPKLCILSYGEKNYKPQRKAGRCGILKELWDSRRIKNLKGGIKREGSVKMVWELAIAGNFVKDEEEFNQKKATADRSVRDAVQDLRDKLKEMNAPAEIMTQSGFMLVVKE